ncbi:MAG: hypothetical protein ACYTDX_01100 [Planctomycetota bacterium]
MRAFWIVPTALFLAACSSLEAPPRTVPQAEELTEAEQSDYLLALEEAARGRERRALAALGALLQRRPVHVPSHLMRQDLLRSLGEDEGMAAEYADLAVAGDVDAGAAVLAVRAGEGSVEERLTEYGEIAVKETTDPWPRIALSTVRAVRARAASDEASRRSRAGFPDEAAQLRAKARVAAERAVVEAERAVAVAPNLSTGHGALAHANALSARLATSDTKTLRKFRADATRAFDAALALDPGDPRLLLGRALLLRDAGKAREAQDDLDLARASSPLDLTVLKARAQNLDLLGRASDAAEAWTECEQLTPGDADIVVELAGSLARAEQWEESLRVYERAVRLYAGSDGPRWRAHRGLATVNTQLGLEGDAARLEEALRHLDLYLSTGGRDDDWAQEMREVLAPADEATDPAEPSSGSPDGA